MKNDKNGMSNETFLKMKGVDIDTYSLIEGATNLANVAERYVAIKVLGSRADRPGSDYWRGIVNSDVKGEIRIEAARILGTNDVHFARESLRRELGKEASLSTKIRISEYLAQLQDDYGYPVICNVLTNQYAGVIDVLHAVRVIRDFAPLGKDAVMPLKVNLERHLANMEGKRSLLYEKQVQDVCEVLADVGDEDTVSWLMLCKESQSSGVRVEMEKTIAKLNSRSAQKKHNIPIQ
jgi:hypothetical protein